MLQQRLAEVELIAKESFQTDDCQHMRAYTAR
jgi:hypothetical protein